MNQPQAQGPLPPAPAAKLKHGFILVAVLIGFAVYSRYREGALSAPVAATSPQQATVAPRASTGDEADTVTMNDYLNLADGMTYAQVVGVIKVSGSEVSRSSAGATTMVMYSWKNAPGRGSLTAMFTNDRLTNKTQFGLK